jgi:hypothetical protein
MQDINLTFKKEITMAPVKESKMEISNTIKADYVLFNADISLIKAIFEIINVYKKMFYVASVKN